MPLIIDLACSNGLVWLRCGCRKSACGDSTGGRYAVVMVTVVVLWLL